MGTNYYSSGSWNCTCDRCGEKKKAHEVQQEWTGFIVCGDCYEVRHPQDFVRAKQDKISVPFTRPIPPLTFTNVSYIIDYVNSDWVVGNYFEE